MKLFRLLRNTKGFTLIELLIVIALLGALAVGLIGALDPFEQLKKGTDTSTRDLVNQMQTAVIRYYSIKSSMPWCDAAGTCADPSGENLLSANVDAGIDRMRVAGELKDDFKDIQANKLALIYVTSDSGLNTVAVCYQPTAKSFQADANTKFDISGVEKAVGECASNGGAATDLCYWCIK